MDRWLNSSGVMGRATTACLKWTAIDSKRTRRAACLQLAAQRGLATMVRLKHGGPRSSAPSHATSAITFLSAVCWLLMGAPQPAVAARPTTLDATVLLLGRYDWRPYQAQPPYTSRCTEMVMRASHLNSNRIQFVPTHYWRDGADGNIASYCWMNSGNADCRSITQESIDDFRFGMELCFRAARDAGFSILHIMPHLDNGDGGDWTIRTWRNGLVFDPRAKYGGWSYEEIMLQPLAAALKPLSGPGGGVQQVYFSLQGEMGATVMRYPDQYKALMPVLAAAMGGSFSPPYSSHTDKEEGYGLGRRGGSFLERFVRSFSSDEPAEDLTPSNSSSTENSAATENWNHMTTSGIYNSGTTSRQNTSTSSTASNSTSTTGGGGGAGAGAGEGSGLGSSKRNKSGDGVDSGNTSSTAAPSSTLAAEDPISDDVTVSITEPKAGKSQQQQVDDSNQRNASMATQLQQQQSGGGGAVIKFGVTFNFIYSDGRQAASSTVLGALGTTMFGWAFGFRNGYGAPAYDSAAVESLLSQCHFIGISAYAPLNGPDFPATALQNSAFNMMDAFDQAGVDLAGIMRRTAAELLYVEYGVGGGTSQAGVTPSSSPNEASNKPFWGVQEHYMRSVDPWAKKDMADFRRTFYSKSLDWLRQGGGPSYNVAACFVWCKGSWDVLGVYPESNSGEGSYKDDWVIGRIRDHNARITGR